MTSSSSAESFPPGESTLGPPERASAETVKAVLQLDNQDWSNFVAHGRQANKVMCNTNERWRNINVTWKALGRGDLETGRQKLREQIMAGGSEKLQKRFGDDPLSEISKWAGDNRLYNSRRTWIENQRSTQMQKQKLPGIDSILRQPGDGGGL